MGGPVPWPQHDLRFYALHLSTMRAVPASPAHPPLTLYLTHIDDNSEAFVDRVVLLPSREAPLLVEISGY